MAITSMQAAASNMRPPVLFRKATGSSFNAIPRSFWPEAGFPAAGIQDTTLNGAALSSTSAQVQGQLYFTNPASGNAYLAKLSASASHKNGRVGLLLCDRLWHNGGYTITSTSAQNSTTPAWPSRDAAGSTNGDGVLLGLEISSATGAGTPTVTISYTNQAGTSGRSSVNIFATAASCPLGSFYPIGLQSGDTGVRSVQSLTLSATWTSGTMNLVAYRPLALLTAAGLMRSSSIDALTGGFPRLYNGSVPFLICTPEFNGNSIYAGSVTWTHG